MLQVTPWRIAVAISTGLALAAPPTEANSEQRSSGDLAKKVAGARPCWSAVDRRWVPHGAVVGRMSVYGPTLSVTQPRGHLICNDGVWIDYRKK
jgi:hypothetical protein